MQKCLLRLPRRRGVSPPVRVAAFGELGRAKGLRTRPRSSSGERRCRGRQQGLGGDAERGASSVPRAGLPPEGKHWARPAEPSSPDESRGGSGWTEMGVWRSNPISHSLRLVRVSMRERGESRVSSSHRVSEAHRSKLLDHPRLHALSWPRCGRDLWRTTGGGESRTPKSYRSPTVGRDGAPTPSLGSNLYEHTPCRRRVGSPSSSERATRPESGSLLVVSFAAHKLENFNIIYLSFGLV